jgi:hypothetical protein
MGLRRLHLRRSRLAKRSGEAAVPSNLEIIQKNRASLQASSSCKTPGEIIGRDYAANFASDVDNSISVLITLAGNAQR